MQIRTDVKRAAADVLSADSWFAALPKMAAMLLLFSAWKLLWNAGLTDQAEAGIIPLILNGFAECLPFIILSYYATIKQVQILKKLSLRSRKDHLTGLNNRQTFLENATARLKKRPSGVLLLIDADYFKQVNDCYGHAVGDNCIEAIGHRLHWNMREFDVVGRLGGEEFAVLLYGLSTSQAITVAERIGLPISFSSGNEQNDLSITVSIGMVNINESTEIDDLLVMADDALYDAKRSGRAKLAEWTGGTTEIICDLSTNGPVERRERRQSVA